MSHAPHDRPDDAERLLLRPSPASHAMPWGTGRRGAGLANRQRVSTRPSRCVSRPRGRPPSSVPPPAAAQSTPATRAATLHAFASSRGARRESGSRPFSAIRPAASRHPQSAGFVPAHDPPSAWCGLGHQGCQAGTDAIAPVSITKTRSTRPGLSIRFPAREPPGHSAKLIRLTFHEP